MLSPAPATIAESPTRILKLSRVLGRLRPLRLRVARQMLEEHDRWARALSLFRKLRPDDMDQINMGTAWEDILWLLCRLVEKDDWFEVDWQALDYAYEVMMQAPCDQDGEPEPPWLAEYLVGLPVRCYGATEVEIEENSGIYALLGLLTDRVSMTSKDLVDLDLYDNLTEAYKAELYQAVVYTDFSHLPEPLCWLDQIAEVLAGNTGNVILDSTSFDLWDGWWPDKLTWENDLALIRSSWPEAKERARQVDLFREWGREADPEDIYEPVMWAWEQYYGDNE